MECATSSRNFTFDFGMSVGMCKESARKEQKLLPFAPAVRSWILRYFGATGVSWPNYRRELGYWKRNQVRALNPKP